MDEKQMYRLLADAVVVLHLAYVLAVIVGLVAIVIGLMRGWRWVRNPWFRFTHLVMIGIVVVQAWLGALCPLTILENKLRVAAGEQAYTRTFIGQLAHDVLFYEAPPWVFTLTYSVFGGLVLATFVLGPPKRHWREVK